MPCFFGEKFPIKGLARTISGFLFHLLFMPLFFFIGIFSHRRQRVNGTNAPLLSGREGAYFWRSYMIRPPTNRELRAKYLHPFSRLKSDPRASNMKAGSKHPIKAENRVKTSPTLKIFSKSKGAGI